MTWGAIGGAAIATVGGAMLSDKGGGGGGTTTQSKEPWAPAVPWITSNLQAGQDLQNYYQQNPFNALQQGAYANLFGGNDYINQMTPGLLAQMSQPTGFDRNNPRARPQAYQFPTMTGANFPMRGLLTNDPGSGNASGMNMAQSPYRSGLLTSSPVAPAPVASGPAGYDLTTQQGMLDWSRSLGGAGGSY
jgi:hypothetical protein